MNQSQNPSYYLREIRPTTWEEVLGEWKKLEEEVWEEHYKGRGYRTWDLWRNEYVKLFQPQTRPWKLYEVTDPVGFAQNCLVGAYRGWRKYLDGSPVGMFKEVAMHPDIDENAGVQAAMRRRSENSQIMGFRMRDHLVIRDGTHRVTAMALCDRLKLQWRGEVTIALTDFAPEERNLFIKAFDQQFAL